ncbi:APG12-domain-containing protein [Tilletiopsis washingtonensis]|uniref:Ubiquitin-like protein ATG12 n=1 Tax=Tilletiopsis washingtonensis TaxID=58919 RepID=A0A316Z170_9BASI|nr:APG12-domain-containing protein [Tilletiopsis washingtonensis]PWN95537.1 APG12-domain-containing protein [Tilletiopsis washingtonensis]
MAAASPTTPSASGSSSAAAAPAAAAAAAAAPASGSGSGSGSAGSPALPLATASAAAAAAAAQVAHALDTYRRKDTSKAVVVRFKAIGNAPIMKNNYFRITAFNRFHAVVVFLRKELGWKSGDALFLYINSSFAPAPDDTVGNLYRCFGTEGHLIVNYSTQAAWG